MLEAIKKPKLILCDIEGTTTDIAFVKNVLFPYAKQNVWTFLQHNRSNDEIKSLIKLLWEHYRLEKPDVKSKPVVDDFTNLEDSKSIDAIVGYVEWLIEIDRKTPPFKQLQGLIWRAGYENGLIKGHVYEDVPGKFQEWTLNNISIGIYSSGSVVAQKLLFGCSIFGDLTKYISYHYDTNVGHKREVESYKTIAKQVNISPGDILFLTDIPQEADAAIASGMRSILLERDGVQLTTEDKARLPCVTSFDQIKF